MQLNSIISVSTWLPVFWTVYLIGCLSPRCLGLFLEFWSVLSFWPYFFVSLHLVHGKGWSLRYSPGWGNPLCCVVVLPVGEGSEGEQCCFLGSHPTFCHFPCFPQADCALSGADSWVGGFVYILGPCGPLVETGSFSSSCNPYGFFITRGFESSVSCTETLDFSVCLPHRSFLLAYLLPSVGSPMWSTTLPCPEYTPPWLPVSAPSSSLDECFFNSLAVGLPCKWFSGSSGCSLFLNWLLSFFWLWEEMKLAAYVFILAGPSRTISTIF